MTLQTALRQLRTELNINQKEMAKLVGIDATTLNRWEKGRITPQRASSLLLLDFAKDRGVSKACQDTLKDALFPKYRIEAEVNDLRATEIGRINDLVNESSNGVIVIDMETLDILYTNNRMLEIKNQLLENVKTMKCYQFLMHAEKQCESCSVCCGGPDSYYEEEYVSPYTGKYYLIRSREIRWSEKRAQLKYITDVTEMHRVKEEAEYLRESLRMATSFAKVSVFLYDLKNQSARLISRAEDQAGLPEYINHFPQVVIEEGIIAPEHVEQYKRMFSDIASGKEHAVIEIRVRTPQGIWRWRRFQMHLTKTDEEGNPELAVCSVADIDREKSMERRIRFEHQKILEEGKGLLTCVVSNLTKNRTVEERYFGEDKLPKVDSLYETAIMNSCNYLVQEKDKEIFRKIHDRKNLIANYQRGIQTYSQQYQLKTLSGHIIWAKNTLNLYQDTETEEIYLYEYCFDIFEQKLLDGMVYATNLYHYDVFGMIFLNNGQLTKIKYLPDTRSHETEVVFYEEEAELLQNRYMCEEDKAILEPYIKLDFLKKELEEKNLISLLFQIKMKDGTKHRMLERISWYDKENQICFISILDVDKIKDDIK